MNDMDVRVVRDWRLKCEGLERVVLGQEDRLDALEKRNAALKADLEASQADLESTRGQAARLQDSLDAIERSTGFVPGNEPLASWVERLKAKLDAAEAAGAQMRKTLQWLWDDDEMGWLYDDQTKECAKCGHVAPGHDEFCAQAQLERALAPDCGKSFLEALKAAQEALERLSVYPIHSEPMGGAMDMQDIADKAIARLKELGL